MSAVINQIEEQLNAKILLLRIFFIKENKSNKK